MSFLNNCMIYVINIFCKYYNNYDHNLLSHFDKCQELLVTTRFLADKSVCQAPLEYILTNKSKLP